MKRQVIPFTTKEAWLTERAKDITSTEISALFGINPWLTAFELWHRKKNKDLGQFEENTRMKWGKRLQESIANGIAEDKEWGIKPKTEYIRLEGLGIGSSFDYEILMPRALLEIKNVDSLAFKNGWLLDGEDLQAPVYYELQCQHEMLVSGIDTLYLGALVGGNNPKVIERKADEKIHKAILEKCEDFWESIKENKEPEPNFERDSCFIAELFNTATKDKVVDVSEQLDYLSLTQEYKAFGEQETIAKKMKDSIKAKLLMKVGDAEKVVGNGFSIVLSETKESSYTVNRKAGRMFRIYWEKGENNDGE